MGDQADPIPSRMKRRARTDEEKEAILHRAIEFLREDLQRSSAILGFGKGLLINMFLKRGEVLVS